MTRKIKILQKAIQIRKAFGLDTTEASIELSKAYLSDFFTNLKK